ncbi:MAG TPA: LamB/YcsF family protein, partial [Ktedonobacterales bacterium]|nr:LamB/YcsF family protein [Ktedonobacterales bacterium]
EVEAWTLAQIGALAGVARAVGVPLRHVKPHGALYNQAAEDEALAEAIARAVRAFDPDLTLVVRAGSPQVEVSKAAGLRVAEEAFADRGYDAHGRLVSRGHPDALVRRPEEAASRTLGLLRSGTIMAVDGTPLTLRADTICFHSDSPGAARMAEAVRDALIAAGVSLAPMSLSASPGGDLRP